MNTPKEAPMPRPDVVPAGSRIPVVAARANCRRGRLSVVALVALIATSVTPTSPARAQAPVAEAPVLNVGDQWRWTFGRSRRIVAVEGELVASPFSNERCNRCTAYRDRNLTIVKLVDKDGKVVDDPEVGYKQLDFPLKIGKTWDSDQVLLNNVTRVGQPYKNAFAVEAYEEVKTKAGTFKAFRISHIQQRAHSSFDGDAGRSWWRQTLWYSPEVGAFVKREVNSKVNWGPDWELESYSLKSRSTAMAVPPVAAAQTTPSAAAPPSAGARSDSPPTWPDLSKAQAGLSQSPVMVVMWSTNIEAPGADVSPDKAKWSGRWAGWACRQQSCDARLIVEKVTAEGASIIYGFASKDVAPVTARLEAKFVGQELQATFRDGATVAYRMRPEGDVEVYYRRESYWYGGVLSKEK